MLASRPALVLISGLGIAVVFVGAVTTSGWARRTTERIAHLFGEDESQAALGSHLGNAGAGPRRVEVDAAGHQRR